ncbi:MAG TPA: hypothetical protein VHG28_13590 [Longimicrobiaceae bacterium]|nr:hypothetical protein [Longimicrobiaceae bacterium]
MKVSNDAEAAPTGPLSELFHLQTEFQARLAEETLRYLRRLQGTLGPAAPGTVLSPGPGDGLRAAGAPGETVVLSLELENLQRVHCVVSPQLTPLVSTEGATWFPAAETAPYRLVAPGETTVLTLALPLPGVLPPGCYRGALVLQGFRDGAVAIEVAVSAPAPVRRAARRRG